MALKAKTLYNALRENGYELESASPEDFYSKLQDDPSKAVTLYNALKQDESFALDSKSPDDFLERLGLKKKDLGTPTGTSTVASGGAISTSASATSGQANQTKTPNNGFQTLPNGAKIYIGELPTPPPGVQPSNYQNINSFFGSPTIDRPDLHVVRKQAKEATQMQDEAEEKQVQEFLRKGDPKLLDDGKGGSILDRIEERRRTQAFLDGQKAEETDRILAQERKDFSKRFYNGELTGKDVEDIQFANPIAYPPEYAAQPADATAASINNKTKNLTMYAKSVVEAGASQYAATRQSLQDAIDQSQRELDDYSGTNYIYQENGVYTTAVPDKQWMADKANKLRKTIDDANLKKQFVEKSFKENVYDPHVRQVITGSLLPEIQKEYAGMSMEDIYKYNGGLQMQGGDAPSPTMLAAMKAQHKDPNFKLSDIIKYDNTNHLTKESVLALRERIIGMVNKSNDPIISAYEHGVRQTDNPIDPEDLISKTINYFNYELPASVLAEGYKNNFKKTEQGKKVATFMDNQKELQQLFSNENVKQYESAIKASLDAGYVTINNKYDKLLASNPQYMEIVNKWTDRINQKLVTPQQAQNEVEKDMKANAALKPIIEAREQEISKLRNTGNKQREKFLIGGLTKINSDLTLDDNGAVTLRGVPREELEGIINEYQKGYNKTIADTYGGQEKLLADYADGINLAIKKDWGGLLSSFAVGVKGSVDDLGSATARWLYHKTGNAGAAMNYFEAEQQRPLNIGDYASEHFSFQGLKSLVDPAYYGFAAGQSFPYAAPAIVAGVATGGSGTAIVGSALFGATLETAENALMTRNELYMTGTNANGLKLTSEEADRAAAENFQQELLPNITLQALELGALLRTGKYVKPSLSLKGVGGAAADVGKAGLTEAGQEGIQGLIQYNAKQKAEGKPELDMFDYMQTDDFTQNFFGGLAGGIGMGGAVKPLTYMKSVKNWKGMMMDSKNAFGSAVQNDFVDGVPYANALHAEMNGTGYEFRDGIRMRLQNEQFKDNEEKESLKRTLNYSSKLKESVAREGGVPSDINNVYVVHASAMSDLYEDLAATDEGKSSLSKTYKDKATMFRNEAASAAAGDAKVYYAIDALDRPIFMTEKTANVLGVSGTLNQWKEKGFINDVNAINDPVFNEKIAVPVKQTSKAAPQQQQAQPGNASVMPFTETAVDLDAPTFSDNEQAAIEGIKAKDFSENYSIAAMAKVIKDPQSTPRQLRTALREISDQLNATVSSEEIGGLLGGKLSDQIFDLGYPAIDEKAIVKDTLGVPLSQFSPEQLSKRKVQLEAALTVPGIEQADIDNINKELTAVNERLAAPQQAAQPVPALEQGVSYKSKVEGIEDATVSSIADGNVNVQFSDGSTLSVPEADFREMYEAGTNNAPAALAVAPDADPNNRVPLKTLDLTPSDNIHTALDKLIKYNGKFTRLFTAMKTDPNISKVVLNLGANLNEYGLYHPEGKGAANPNLLQVSDKGNTYYTLAHELLHFFTIDSAVAQEAKNTDGYRALEDMYHYIAAKKGKPVAGTASIENYALTDFREFMAELLINPKFREYVSDVYVTNKEDIDKTSKYIRSQKAIGIADLIVNFFRDLFDKLFSKKESGVSLDEKKSVVENAAQLATELFFGGTNVKVSELTAVQGGQQQDQIKTAALDIPSNEGVKPLAFPDFSQQKPIRNQGESMADYTNRVLQWRKQALSSGSAEAATEALSTSQPEMDFIKGVNQGIEVLRGNINMTQDEFNKALSLPVGSSETYIAALKYLKSTNKQAAQLLNAMRSQDPKKIAMTELALLKKQFRDWERGYIAGDKEATGKIKAIRQEIDGMLKEYNDQGLFAGVEYTPQELVRMGRYVGNAMNETSLDNFKNMLNGLLDKAEYGRKLAAAKQAIKDIKKFNKRADIITANDNSLLKDLTNLNPLRVEDIDKLLDIVTDVASSRKANPTSVRTYGNEAIEKYVDDQREYDIKERATEAIEKYFALKDSESYKKLEQSGKVGKIPGDVEFQSYVDSIANSASPLNYEEKVREMNRLKEVLNYLQKDANDKAVLDPAIVTPLDYAAATAAVASDDEVSDRTNNRQVLEDMARAQQEAINLDDPDFTTEQKDVLGKMKNLDVTGFDSNSLRLFMNVINNIVINGNLAGAGIFESKTEARDNAVKGFTDWLKDNDYKVRQKGQKGKIRKNLSDLKKAFSSTEQIIWHIANNASSLASKIFQTVQLDKIKSGYAKTVHDLNAEVFEKLNPLFKEGLKQDADTNVRMTLYSWLNQNKNGSLLENQTEFTKRVNEVKRDIAIKEQYGKDADKAEAEIVKGVFNEIRQKILDKTGVDIENANFEGLDNSVLNDIDILSDVQKKAYDVFRSTYDKTRPMFEEIMERHLNKEFVGWNNYMPDTFRKLFGGVIDVDLNADNFGQSIFARASSDIDDASGPFAGRVDGNRFIEPKSGEDTRVINYNWFDNNVSNSKEMMFDINTLKDRQVAADVFKNKDMEAEIGRDNMEVLKEAMIKELKAMTGLQGKSAARYLKAFKSVANSLGGIAAKMQLVSVAAYFKQAWSAYMNTAAYMGTDAPYMFKAMGMIDSNPDVKKLVDNNEISLRGTTKAGTNIFGDKNVTERESRVGGNDLLKSAEKLSNTINGKNNLTGDEKSMMRFFLERGDVVSAQASWVALYGQWLVKNGVYDSWSNIDWAKEAETTNRDAAAYAQLVTSKQLNVNSRNAFGEVYTDPNAALSILKSLFGLFGNFGFNKSIAILNNAMTLASKKGDVSTEQRKEETEFARKSLAAGLSEELMFQAVKGILVKLTLSPLFFGLLTALTDDEEEKEKLRKAKAKDIANAFKNYVPNVISNYFFSFAGSIGQTQLQEWGNDVFKQFGGKDNIFYQASEDPNYKKNEGLWYAATGGLGGDMERMWKLMTDRTDRFGGKVTEPKRSEYIMSAVAIISNIAQMLKLNDADVNRLVQKRMRMMDIDLDKRYKEPYYRDIVKDNAMSEHLVIAGRKRDLTPEQQEYYYQMKQERKLQLEKSPLSDEKKQEFVEQYGKAKLLLKYKNQGLAISPPEEKKKK